MAMIKKLSVIVMLIVLIMTGGVYAVWEYAGQPFDPVEEQLHFEVGDFLWEGSGSLW